MGWGFSPFFLFYILSEGTGLGVLSRDLFPRFGSNADGFAGARGLVL